MLGPVRLLDGRLVDVVVVDGRFEALTPTGDGARPDLPRVDGEGRMLLPAFVDSHVHLTFYPVAEALARSGVLAAVDLAAPRATLVEPPAELRLLASGPMLTPPGGYPTTSWGAGGYGLEVADGPAAERAALALLDEGAELLKVPLGFEPDLSDEALEAVVEVAHGRGVRVAAHALSDEAAARAARFDCALLAHTPTEPLSEETLEAWASRAVVSTLVAFGDGEAARDNLGQLFTRGATVLYGTDLGNLRTPSISSRELDALVAAGLTPDQALDAATEVPARYFGLDVGALRLGAPASFLLTSTDPREDFSVLTRPSAVYAAGRELTPP